jgi:hypothetical protein
MGSAPSVLTGLHRPIPQGFIRRSCPSAWSLDAAPCGSLPHPISQELHLELVLQGAEEEDFPSANVAWWRDGVELSNANLSASGGGGGGGSNGTAWLVIGPDELARDGGAISEIGVSAKVSFPGAEYPAATYSVIVALDRGPACLAVARSCLETFALPRRSGFAAVASGWVALGASTPVSVSPLRLGSHADSSAGVQPSESMLFEFGEVLPFSGTYLAHATRRR